MGLMEAGVEGGTISLSEAKVGQHGIRLCRDRLPLR
jgi:hypothetical protein